MRDRLIKLGLEGDVQVLSAGVWAEQGDRASTGSIAALRYQGIDLAAHRSQPLTPALLKSANIILVMEEAHRRSIFYMVPEVLPRVFLLSEMAGRHEDVADPYGGSAEEYAETADELAQLIDNGMAKILKRLSLQAPKPTGS